MVRRNKLLQVFALVAFAALVGAWGHAVFVVAPIPAYAARYLGPDEHADAPFTDTVYVQALTAGAASPGAAGLWYQLSALNENTDDILISFDGGTTDHVRIPANGEVAIETRLGFDRVHVKLASGSGGATLIINVS